MYSKKLWWTGLFAIGMAFIEAATVVYLRRVLNIHDLLLDIPPFNPELTPIEIGRELSTLIMLFAVGWAVGKSWQTRVGFLFFAFGIWDIFYYGWLRIFIAWPDSIFAQDLLFLIPLPWWGPVIAPLLIAGLMIVGGILAVNAEDNGYAIKASGTDWIALFIGLIALLFSFMKDAIMKLPTSVETLASLRPGSFDWWIYLPGLVLTSYIVLKITIQKRIKQGAQK